MRISTFLRTHVILLGLLLLFPIKSTAQSRLDAEFESYLAHIAAASSALRLHETGEAKRWLAAGPVKHRNWEWHYLNAQAEQSSAIAGGWTGNLKMWEVATGKELASWNANKGSVNAIAASPDGKRMATVGNDGAVLLWDVEARQLLRSFDEVRGIQLTTVAFSPDGNRLAVLPFDRTIRLLNAGPR